jgi:predicted DCC family thiol-disulfide oxidoreductase YuxK
VLRFDRDRVFRLASLQSPVGRALLERFGRSPDDISTIVLCFDDQCMIKSEAVLSIGAMLPGPLGLFPPLAAFAMLLPLRLRDALYDVVASNRYRLFGRSESCRLPDTGRLADRFL